MRKVNKDIKIGIFDLEIVGAGFGAERSNLFTFGRMTLNEPKTLKVTSMFKNYRKVWDKDKLAEKPLLKEMKEFFENHQVVIAHFGSKFDLPYIRAKLLKYKMQPVREPYFIDTWRLSKLRLKLGNNRLATLIELLNIPHKKTWFDVDLWRKAEHGNLKYCGYIHKHCAIDVLALNEVVNRLGDIIWDQPSIAIISTSTWRCLKPKCKGKLYGKGNRRTKTQEYHRRVCVKCHQHYRTEGERWSY